MFLLISNLAKNLTDYSTHECWHIKLFAVPNGNENELPENYWPVMFKISHP